MRSGWLAHVAGQWARPSLIQIVALSEPISVGVTFVALIQNNPIRKNKDRVYGKRKCTSNDYDTGFKMTKL